MGQAPSVTVAGAGIGGLAAALLLARSGFAVRLLERSAAPLTSGAGIQITPNAGRILAELGLEDAIAAAGGEPAAILVRSGRTGRRIAALPLGPDFARRFGAPYRTIHREDLHRVLLSAAEAEAGIDLLFGHGVVDCARHIRGLTVLAETAAGDVEFGTAALIGADGIASEVRRTIEGAGVRRESGRSAWRTLVRAEDMPAGIDAEAIGLWLGRAGHVVHYPVRGGKAVNVVVVLPDRKLAGRLESAAESAAVPRALRRWAKPVTALLAASADWRRWPIATVDPSAVWSMDRVALLGDAAHAMAPFLAQGGAMAIEDAAVLAAAMTASPDDPAAAIAAYEAERRPRVAQVWRAAERVAQLYHLGALRSVARNAGMRLLGGRALINRYTWIYGWRPGDANEKRRPKAAPVAPAGASPVR